MSLKSCHNTLRDDEFWRRIPAFSSVTREEFLDYRFQVKHSASSLDRLLQLLTGIAPAAFLEDLREGMARAPMAVRLTPYVLSLVDWSDPWSDPIRKQYLPLASSILPNHPMLKLDSLHEQGDSPVPGLVHRYRDKALFLAQQSCPVYCRFCTRSYAVGPSTELVDKIDLGMRPSSWDEVFAYLEAHPEVEDVVVSGGDVYNLAPALLSHIGDRLLAIESIRRIRFATKGIGVMPMRLLTDAAWADALIHVAERGRALGKHVALHTHINHPDEITAVTGDAAAVLFSRGVTMRNQLVVLRGVNDDANTMRLLIKRLGEVNIQPYYAYQHDMVSGVEDLRTSLATTLELEKDVRGVTAGFNVPLFVVDAPGGGGKRNAWSFEHYDRETGVSVFTAPYTKPGKSFLYFDPLHALSPAVQQDWQSPLRQEEMVASALEAATRSPRGR